MKLNEQQQLFLSISFLMLVIVLGAILRVGDVPANGIYKTFEYLLQNELFVSFILFVFHWFTFNLI